MNKIIIDSDLELKDVMLQNPQHPHPEEMLKDLGLMQVTYMGFDGQIHRGQIVVAAKVMTDVEAFFSQALEMNFPIEKVVPLSAPEYRWDNKKAVKDNISVGFDYRLGNNLDENYYHAKGYAFDINPRQNPYIVYDKDLQPVSGVPRKNAVIDINKPGTLHDSHPLVKMMEGFGWEWGGHWSPETGRVDYMHFQKQL